MFLLCCQFYNKVTAVSFFDFNADGVKDILIIGESDMGENIRLEESVPNEYYYETCYAGAVQYDSYMTSHDGKEISTDFYVESLFFKDTDGDRTPSEEELSATEEMEVFEARYRNCTGIEMSEDEIKSQIAEYDSYHYEELTGDMSYDELISSLK